MQPPTPGCRNGTIGPAHPPLATGAGRLWAMVLAVALAAGCESTPSTTGGMAETRPAAVESRVDPSDLDDMSFLHDYLVKRPTVTVDDGYRAMLILANGRCDARTFEQREAALEQRGIARPAWNLRPDQKLDKGTVAYMACVIMKIRGGVNRVIFGSWGPGDRRYALRELVYREMMADSPAYRYITGAELVALLGKADAYMQKHHEYEAESVEIGTEPPAGSPAGPR